MNEETPKWDNLCTLSEGIKLLRKGDGPPWDLYVRIPGKYKDNTLKVDSILTIIKNLFGLISELSLDPLDLIVAKITVFISFFSSLLKKLLKRFCFEYHPEASVETVLGVSASADVISREDKNE